MKRVFGGKLATGITSGVGFLVVVGVLAMVARKAAFLRSVEPITGVVIDDANCPEIGYVDAQEVKHRFALNSCQSPPAYHLGEKVKIWVDPVDSNHREVEGYFSLWGVHTVAGGIGLCCFGLSFVLFLRFKKDAEIIQAAKDRGEKISAKVIAVNRLMETEDGDVAFTINAQQNIDGKVYTFVSENIWYNPTDYIEGETVDVYYLKEDPRKYWVDISFLPQKG